MNLLSWLQSILETRVHIITQYVHRAYLKVVVLLLLVVTSCTAIPARPDCRQQRSTVLLISAGTDLHDSWKHVQPRADHEEMVNVSKTFPQAESAVEGIPGGEQGGVLRYATQSMSPSACWYNGVI